MKLSKMLGNARELFGGVDKGLRDIREELAKTDKDSDPAKYTHLVLQESILVGIWYALIKVKDEIQQLIALYGEEHEIP